MDIKVARLSGVIMEMHMTLASHGLAFVLGYLLGRPDGRRQLAELRQQVTELAGRPEVKRLGKRGWDLAGEGALAARSAVSSRLRGNGTVSEAAAREPDTGSPVSGRRGLRRRARAEATAPAVPDTAPTPDESAGSDPAREPTSGFGGTTPLEDTQAVITGIPAPPPAGRTHPPRPPQAD